MENFEIGLSELLEVDSIKQSDEFESFEAWDSLTSLSIIAFIDERYHVSISAKDIIESKTIGGLKQLVLSKSPND